MLKNTLATSEDQLVKEIIEAIAQDELTASRIMLRTLALESYELPQQWLLDTADALETENWNLLSSGFANQKFKGQNGRFLIIAPYTICREATKSTKLTAIYGQLIPVAHPVLEKLEGIANQQIGMLHQPIPKILPYKRFAACGNVGDEEGEAFVVSNNWDFPDSFKGSSLNDFTEQRCRFLESGRECIRRIWSPDSASLLLAALEDEAISLHNCHLEYSFHDTGHATGLGINRKVEEKLFATYWYAAVEEWRADGVEFDLALKALSKEEAGQLIAVNLFVRLALDAHRSGGLDRDSDVCASLLTFDRLLESGEINIKDGCLSLREPSYECLLRAIEPHRTEAVRLTQQELALEYSTGIFRLYGSVKYNPLTEKLFKWLILERCQHLYKILR